MSLVRQRGEDTTDLATLSELVTRVGKFMLENPDIILYYYCDECLSDNASVKNKHLDTCATTFL